MNIEIGESRELRRSSRKRSRVHHEDDCSTSRESRKARKIQQLRMKQSSSKEQDRKEERKIFYQDFKCAICLEIVTDPHIIPECCHRFCGSCIKESIQARHNECPTCRQHISTKRSLRKDELIGKLLDRLQQLEKENEDLRSKLEMNEDEFLPLSSDSENENESDQHSVEIFSFDSSEHDDNMENESGQELQPEPVGAAIVRHEYGNKFEERLADLQRFKNEHGHCNVPFHYEKNKSLGRWCCRIRRMKSGRMPNDGTYKLTDERITKLEEMGFQWKVSRLGGRPIKTFEERLADLQRFKNKHGHCNVPKSYKENPSLGSWCNNIRTMKSGSKRNVGVYKLTDDRITKLEHMGFQWKVNKGVRPSKTFEERLADLQYFKNKHGHCNVPKSYKENPSLGSWCSNIRTMKSGSVPNVGVYKLTDDRITKLEEMGFQWKVSRLGGRPGKTFEERLADLQYFKNKHGHCNVPKSYDPSLGKWCCRIRRMKSGSKRNVGVYKLTDERITKLEHMGFQWKVNKGVRPIKTFEERLADLQYFKNKHGHCNVPKSYKENPSLGSWCSNIRTMKSGSKRNVGVYKLTDERITKLEHMGFQWRVMAKRTEKNGRKTFEERLADLQRFKNKHGHCNVPSKYEENPSLGYWCGNIRRMKSGSRKNVGVYKLTDDRITKLEDLGFRWS